jgi:hypothetical protein
VWVVIRLCTDNHKMVDYWNNVDGQVALSMDVLDDPQGEAKETFRYCTALHCTVQCLVHSIRLRSLSGDKGTFQCL